MNEDKMQSEVDYCMHETFYYTNLVVIHTHAHTQTNIELRHVTFLKKGGKWERENKLKQQTETQGKRNKTQIYQKR